MMMLLVEYDADIHLGFLFCTTENTPISLSAIGFVLLRMQNIPLIFLRFLFIADASADRFGFNSFHYAAKNGNSLAMHYLVGLGIDQVFQE